ncbi:MAG: RAMP superfamily protein [Oscillatoriales cyanobacterium RM2_1_1]|nr:RAMP superfamily protein [Oscillatoriales cyanobacterium RM2_1_1]
MTIDKIPMMFQAQIKERCQLQYAGNSKVVEQWTEEWTSGVEPRDTQLESSNRLQKRSFKISWRFVTNGGQDDGIIRPVIGKYGLPYYPGSSMKGAFCQACTKEQLKTYKLNKDADHPSLLRFHGGYPINSDWKEGLIDLTHPQQNFQVGTDEGGHSAKVLVSLYQPEIEFCISAVYPNKPENIDWEEIWAIWKKALGQGIGCRVSAGYGQSNELFEEIEDEILYRTCLHGQGAAAKLLDGKKTPEFRPNIFRAGIRGHALRIFGGLNQSKAEIIVDELFGGIHGPEGAEVGWLRMSFYPESDEWQDTNLPEGSPDQHLAYDVAGQLVWTLAKSHYEIEKGNKIEVRELEERRKSALKKLIQKLTEFAMVLGGFGKSWRRADHQKFHPDYKKNRIGCHWEWLHAGDNPISDESQTIKDLGAEVSKFLAEVQEVAKEWMKLKDIPVIAPPSKPSESVTKPAQKSRPSSSSSSPSRLIRRPRPVPKNTQSQTSSGQLWREAWRSDNVEVWGRIGKNDRNSWVIPWLHDRRNAQQPKNQNHGQSRTPTSTVMSRGARPGDKPKPEQSIYKSDLTGQLNQIGRLWHRMYPLDSGKYLELITIFHQNCEVCENFLEWLKSQRSNPNSFQKLWPVE